MSDPLEKPKGNWGGYQPNAGRPKGSLNKRTIELRVAAARGTTPLQVMLDAMTFYYNRAMKQIAAMEAKGLDEDSPAGARALEKIQADLEEASKHAARGAPYVHPKLVSKQVAIRKLSEMTDEELAAAVLDAEEAVASIHRRVGQGSAEARGQMQLSSAI